VERAADTAWEAAALGLGAEINERLDVDAALESREGGVAHPGARGVLFDIAEVHFDVCSLIAEIQERQ
jgi:hypothetical protein